MEITSECFTQVYSNSQQGDNMQYQKLSHVGYKSLTVALTVTLTGDKQQKHSNIERWSSYNNENTRETDVLKNISYHNKELKNIYE